MVECMKTFGFHTHHIQICNLLTSEGKGPRNQFDLGKSQHCQLIFFRVTCPKTHLGQQKVPSSDGSTTQSLFYPTSNKLPISDGSVPVKESNLTSSWVKQDEVTSSDGRLLKNGFPVRNGSEGDVKLLSLGRKVPLHMLPHKLAYFNDDKLRSSDCSMPVSWFLDKDRWANSIIFTSSNGRVIVKCLNVKSRCNKNQQNHTFL